MGESARKPGAPELPVHPEEILIPRPGEGFSWVDKTLPPIISAVTLGLVPAFHNWTVKRPFFAGIYRHLVFGAVGYVVADWFFQFRRAQRAEKDAILLHYISLHPEDFPPIARNRYKDVFLPWTPVR